MKCGTARLTKTRSWPMIPTCATSVHVGLSPFMAPIMVTGVGYQANSDPTFLFMCVSSYLIHVLTLCQRFYYTLILT